MKVKMDGDEWVVKGINSRNIDRIVAQFRQMIQRDAENNEYDLDIDVERTARPSPNINMLVTKGTKATNHTVDSIEAMAELLKNELMDDPHITVAFEAQDWQDNENESED